VRAIRSFKGKEDRDIKAKGSGSSTRMAYRHTRRVLAVRLLGIEGSKRVKRGHS